MFGNTFVFCDPSGFDILDQKGDKMALTKFESILVDALEKLYKTTTGKQMMDKLLESRRSVFFGTKDGTGASVSEMGYDSDIIKFGQFYDGSQIEEPDNHRCYFIEDGKFTSEYKRIATISDIELTLAHEISHILYRAIYKKDILDETQIAFLLDWLHLPKDSFPDINELLAVIMENRVAIELGKKFQRQTYNQIYKGPDANYYTGCIRMTNLDRVPKQKQ
jgi:hypothetical protein